MDLVPVLFPLARFRDREILLGWPCPEGALFELSDFLTLKLLGRRSLYSKKQNDPEGGKEKRLMYGTIAVLSAVVIPLAGGVWR